MKNILVTFVRKTFNLRKILFSLLFILLLFSYKYSLAVHNERYKAIIIEVLEERSSDLGIYQKLRLVLDNNQEVEIVNDSQNTSKYIKYSKSDKVIVEKIQLTEQDYTYIIIDYSRVGYLIFLFVLFTLLAFLVGKKSGLYSLIGMFFSFFMIFKFILPQIISGKDPVLITILASVLIIPVTFYLSHGFNKKTHISIISTVITLIVISIFTSISVNVAKLTGYSSEEAIFLQISNQNLEMKGILLAGIIIGFLGILDDITVSQCSVVMQLRNSNKSIGTLDLYKKAMEVGRDHITSMINTLVLVYAGASLPLLLMFINNPQPIDYVINTELIADEIVRTLTGSIGLIIAVPISTFLASIVFESDISS